MTFYNLFFALLGGVLPAILWLLFWLEEDRLHPEPRHYVLLAFLGGLALLPAALLLEVASTWLFAANTLPSLLIWAAIEECGKLLVAWLIAKRIGLDEPVDAIMYMITVALGFAALENSLFIMGTLNHGTVLSGVIIGNIRFLGSTLLHVVASGLIGAAWAFGLTKPQSARWAILASGVILSIGLHTLFNFFILNSSLTVRLLTSAAVWVLIILLLLLIEEIKRLSSPLAPHKK